MNESPSRWQDCGHVSASDSSRDLWRHNCHVYRIWTPDNRLVCPGWQTMQHAGTLVRRVIDGPAAKAPSVRTDPISESAAP